MSVSSTSSGGPNWNFNAVGGQRPPKEMSKDQLTQLDQQLKSEGKDTSHLDKIIDNFDKLDTNGDGKLSMSELKANAGQYGIQLPKGHHHHHHGGGAEGVQSAQNPIQNTDTLLSPDASGSQGSSNALLNQMVQNFSSSNPPSPDSDDSGLSVNVSA